ncbi:MAG TPA: SAM-dependent methyltransferase [Rudaea sp.]|jgi:precorrin-6B methylase 1|nr:SAM-dependent methyltransferase [Rudaea sp.]
MKKTHAGQRKGSLACVGIGITLGSHLTPLARSHIEQADVVFLAVSDGIVEKWIESLNADVRSLQPFYAEGKSRTKTYREMVSAILKEVRAGKNVCAAFYGHPGVFAWAPHESIRIARKEGYFAHMEPGISAEDCLYADLGIDPGAFGCQHYEASQLLYYRRVIDTSAYLILWQVGAVGDQARARDAVDPAYRQVLIDRLMKDYPPSHKLIIYRATTLPIHAPRIERTTLRKLASAHIEVADTVVLPPARKLVPDTKTLAHLARIDKAKR